MTDYLWTAFPANDSGQNLLVCSSADGGTWHPNIDIQQATEFAPSLAFFKDRLYVAFIANDSGQNVLICTTADGITWQPLSGKGGTDSDIHQASGSAPSLAVFKDRLYVGFVSNDSNQNVLVCSSADGNTWEPLNGGGATNPDIHQASNGSAPSFAVFKDRLYVGFIANNSGQNVLVCSSADGANWEALNGAGGTNPDIHQASNSSAPSLAVFKDRLYVAFIANDSGQNVLVCSSSDGNTWVPLNGAGGTNPDIHQASNGSGPSLAIFNDRLYVAFIANDSGQNVLVCSSDDGKTWKPLNGAGETNPDIHQASNGSAASLAVAPFSYWPITPTGLVSNNNYFFYRRNLKPISGISVTITLTEEMVFASASGGTKGFSFQLNGASEDNPEQQYVIAYLNGELSGNINNWDWDKKHRKYDDIYDVPSALFSVPGNVLPKHIVLTITPTTSADGSAITGATFTASTPTQSPITTSIPITSPTPVGPLITFQLVIVGPDNDASATLLSGAGTIEYTALNGLAAQIGEKGLVEKTFTTGETANVYYSTLSAEPGKHFQQQFKVASALT